MIVFPLKCVVVDDDPTTLKILEKTIEKIDKVEASFHLDSRAASKELSSCNILITDVQMPGLSGVELVSQLRSYPQGRSSFIVVCTGKESYIDAYDCFHAGANTFIRKPVQPKELEQLLQETVGRYEIWNTIFRDIAVGNQAKRTAG